MAAFGGLDGLRALAASGRPASITISTDHNRVRCRVVVHPASAPQVPARLRAHVMQAFDLVLSTANSLSTVDRSHEFSSGMGKMVLWSRLPPSVSSAGPSGGSDDADDDDGSRPYKRKQAPPGGNGDAEDPWTGGNDPWSLGASGAAGLGPPDGPPKHPRRHALPAESAAATSAGTSPSEDGCSEASREGLDLWLPGSAIASCVPDECGIDLDRLVQCFAAAAPVISQNFANHTSFVAASEVRFEQDRPELDYVDQHLIESSLASLVRFGQATAHYEWHFGDMNGMVCKLPDSHLASVADQAYEHLWLDKSEVADTVLPFEIEKCIDGFECLRLLPDGDGLVVLCDDKGITLDSLD